MISLVLNDKLLSVLLAVTQRRALAISEVSIGFTDDWMKVVREYFYDLPIEFTTELGLKRNERCIRAIESFEIPNEWLDAPCEELSQFKFHY